MEEAIFSAYLMILVYDRRGGREKKNNFAFKYSQKNFLLKSFLVGADGTISFSTKVIINIVIMPVWDCSVHVPM